ncbi:MAG: hypothetical protein JWO36_5431 [Myxococcales bacterium]|nr:hypothetical protein [Myxococcales bacterium]
MRSHTVLISLLIACGSNDKAPIDAASDAPPDALVDADLGMPTGTHHHYVIDRQNVPANNTQARMYGLDLNGDQTVDNQLGMVLATFSGMGFNTQTSATTSVDTGRTILLADLQATDLTTATHAGFTIYFGQNPQPAPCTGPSDTVCRHHLTGTGTFDVAASPHDAALRGDLVNGTFTAGPGHLSIQLAMFAASSPVRIDLIGARVRLTNITGTSIGTGVLAGAVTQSDLNTKIIPALQQSMVPVIARDCTMLASPPACGCANGSQGENLLGLLDTSPKDCAVTVSEIQNNALFQSLLAPDVTIDGQMALSLGIGITATGATFTP